MESAFHAENVGFTPEMATCFSAKRHIFSFKYKKKNVSYLIKLLTKVIRKPHMIQKWFYLIERT